GMGGSGKTRLALQVAARLADGNAYPSGVWLIELGALQAGELVPQAIAAALGVREQSGSTLTDTLVAAIGTRAVLLVLDHCEHVPAASVEVADRLLRGCPNVRWLTTSRQALGIMGEAVCPVPPLSLAPPAAPPTPGEAQPLAEAVQLFVDRARLVRPDFA